jgi:hypothetical protein
MKASAEMETGAEAAGIGVKAGAAGGAGRATAGVTGGKGEEPGMGVIYLSDQELDIERYFRFSTSLDERLFVKLLKKP